MIDIQVAAKRYDGGSGSAVFTGPIPLKPGQLFESALNAVSLWDGSTEVGCSVEPLWPRHTDGSVKLVRVAATLNLGSAQKDLILRLGTLRTVNGPGLPTINLAWMRNPRMIAGTDAAHLCSSRVAPFPLVPIPHPNLPAQWNEFLTSQWDDDQVGIGASTQKPNWGILRARTMADGASVNLGGNAGYNFISAMYCKYLTSGSLDRLREAHRASQYGCEPGVYNHGFPWSFRGFCYKSNNNPSPFTNNGHLNEIVRYGDGTIFNANPEGWDDSVGNTFGGGQEPRNQDMDHFMCYQLSGWGQPLGIFLCRTLEVFGRRGFPDNPPFHVPLSNVFGSNMGTSFILDQQFKGNYPGRAQWRHLKTPEYLYWLLSVPDPLYGHRSNGKFSTIPSPRDPSATEAWKLWFKREHIDYMDRYSARYVAGHWLKDTWISTPGWGPATLDANGNVVVQQGVPFFQIKLLVYNAMLHYYHGEPDPRIIDKIVLVADKFKQCLRPNGPHAPTNPVHGVPPGWQLPYVMANAYTNNPTDGPVPAGSQDGFWVVTTLLWLFTLAWQITGDLFYKTLIDTHANHKLMCLADGGRAGGNTPKEAGETYFDAFYAAAIRAGVPIGAWEIDGEIIIPEPDTTPPTAPGQPQISDLSSTGFIGSSSPSTDNVGVTAYAFTLNGVKGPETASPSVTYTGLQPDTDYTVFAESRDAAGNWSDPSPSTLVHTPQEQSGDIMATLTAALTNQDQIHSVDYTGVRIRFQRSTDGGLNWVDVQSTVHPLGTTTDSYGVPVGAIGDYRAGAALTDGAVFGTEVFSDIRTLSLIQTPVNIVLTLVA